MTDFNFREDVLRDETADVDFKGARTYPLQTAMYFKKTKILFVFVLLVGGK